MYKLMTIFLLTVIILTSISAVLDFLNNDTTNGLLSLIIVWLVAIYHSNLSQTIND